MNKMSAFVDDDYLLKTLMHDEDMVKVIRSHLIIEGQIIAFIERALVNNTTLKIDKLNWSMKVDLARALGLSDGYTSALKKLNSIRNHFAHGSMKELDEKIVFDFYNTFSEKSKNELKEDVSITVKYHGSEHSKEFLKAPFGAQFVWMVSKLSQFLRSENVLFNPHGRT